MEDGLPPRDSLFILQTDRLQIRKIIEDDFDSMFAVYGDAESMRFAGDGKAITIENCRRWIEVTQANYEKRGYGMFAVELRETSEVIGFCGIVHPSNQNQAEIKYAFKRPYWQQGFATEAASAMLRFGTLQLGLESINATIHTDHMVSQRVATKIGMQHVDSRQEDDGTITEIYSYRVT